MELVQIRITGPINTSRYDALSSGDLLRTDAAYAQHLVKDLRVAVYLEDQKQPVVDRPTKPKRTRKAKDQS
jgi:hypothetical protein